MREVDTGLESGCTLHCVVRCLTAGCNSTNTRRPCTVASLGTPASSAARASWTSATWISTCNCAARGRVGGRYLPMSPSRSAQCATWALLTARASPNTSPGSTGLSSRPTSLPGGRGFWSDRCAAKHASATFSEEPLGKTHGQTIYVTPVTRILPPRLCWART